MKTSVIVFLLSFSVTFATARVSAENARAARPADRWLFIGDSHSVVSFGDAFRRSMFASGLADRDQWYQYSVSGSTIWHWLGPQIFDLAINYAVLEPHQEKQVLPGNASAPVRPLPDLITHIHPQHIVIALGTNDLFAFQHGKGDFAKLDAQLSAALNSIGDIDCYWILPPNFEATILPVQTQANWNAFVTAKLKSRHCKIADSRSMVLDGHYLMPNQLDRIHFKKDLAWVWGRISALRVTRESSSQL